MKISPEAREASIRRAVTPEEAHPNGGSALANNADVRWMLGEIDRLRTFLKPIQDAAMERGGLDQGVEVDSVTFILEALEQAEAEIGRKDAVLDEVNQRLAELEPKIELLVSRLAAANRMIEQLTRKMREADREHDDTIQ